VNERAGLEAIRDREVLITGGLGFIGSNLAIALVELGARVILLDSMREDHGGNLFNVEPIRDRVTINFSDVRDESSLFLGRSTCPAVLLASPADSPR